MPDLSCGTRDLFAAACGLFVVVCRLLSGSGAQAPEHAGSVVVVHGLSSCGV